MTAVKYAITGPPAPSPAPADGFLPLRIELRNLQANHPDQCNLYLLALQAFYQIDETSDLSFYGVARIHGRPYRPRGGVMGSNPSPSKWHGYCTHSSILFAPWHRPYLALYEQVLYGIVQEIAANFPPTTRARYQEAASTLRIPYWDWAAQPPSGDQHFPNSVGGSATVDVITPDSNGQIVQIDNPLYTYQFNPINPQTKDFPFPPACKHNQWQTTLISSPNAESQDDQVFDAMARNYQSFQSNINLLMNDPNYKVFDAFSNHKWQVGELGTYASIEDVHNTVHGEIGGGGHMNVNNITPPRAGKYTEYICNIRTQKHCLRQTYRVRIFLGRFDPETRTWHTQEALVGTFVAMGKNPEMTWCGKCKKDEQNNVMVTGTVPLTYALLSEYKVGRLGGMGMEAVLPWLKDNLHWRVTIADGSEMPRDEVEGLKISVVTTEVALSVGRLPTYSGVYEVHPELTEGEPAGFGSGDQV